MPVPVRAGVGVGVMKREVLEGVEVGVNIRGGRVVRGCNFCLFFGICVKVSFVIPFLSLPEGCGLVVRGFLVFFVCSFLLFCVVVVDLL